MATKKNKDGYVLKSEIQSIIQNYIRNIQMNDYGNDNGIPQLYRVMKQVESQPTADVEEVRHGEWIKKNGIYVCSECDFTCPYDVVGDNIEYWECLYCPHCRARMDGGNE